MKEKKLFMTRNQGVCFLSIVAFTACFSTAVFAKDTSESDVDTGSRGKYFAKKAYVDASLPTYEQSRGLLPAPILEENPDWVEVYWKCWELGFDHLRKPDPQSPYVANYVDEAFNNNIFQWDTIFMVMFWRYAHSVFPAVESFDNFYCRQHDDGFICREIWERGSKAGQDHHKKTNPQAINPPLFSWAEVACYKLSGDKTRFARVMPVLKKYVEWLEKYRVRPEARHGLYWQTNSGSGMDNTPQRGTAWVEMSAQMVRQYDDLAFMANELGKKEDAEAFTRRGKEISAKINKLMWDEEAGFYWNLQNDNSWAKARTIGFSWTLMAGVASDKQAERVAEHLMDTNTFYRLIPFATLAATHKVYNPTGGYWKGSSWAPTTYQAVKGLERYGYEDEAAAATEKYLTGIAAVYKKTDTVWENYAPDFHERGNQSKPNFVGWTGCGPIALLFENVMGIRPDAPNNRIAWRLRRKDRHGVERLRVGDATLSLVCEKRGSAEAPASLTLEADRKFEIEIIHPKGSQHIKLTPGKAVKLTIPEKKTETISGKLYPAGPFFAFCMDIHDAKKRTLPEQAVMLKELGYAGCGHLWPGQADTRADTLSDAGLRLFQVYVRVNLAKPQSVDEKSVAKILPSLKPHKTQLALLITGGKPSDSKLDDKAVAIIKRIADMAKPYDVKVVLYPHSRDWLETSGDAVRIAKKVNRPDKVGAMFNLCHWMKADANRDLRAVLKEAQPWLMAVSLSGSDTPNEVRAGKGNWIQPLGKGTYDIKDFLDILRDINYSGPVGIQCYGIRGDARTHLEQSIETWKQVTENKQEK